VTRGARVRDDYMVKKPLIGKNARLHSNGLAESRVVRRITVYFE
jgi:hypothetical protein